MVLSCLLLPLAAAQVQHGPCSTRDYGKGSVVCVCNATYCDNFPELTERRAYQVEIYESNKAGLRFSKSVHASNGIVPRSTNDEVIPTVNLTVDRNTEYQTIIGFGGAFTDSAGINIYSLPKDLGQLIIDNYFSPDGIEYTIGRVPVGGADFSTRPYTYDDDHDGDFDLDHFALQDEDFKYKVSTSVILLR